MKAQDITMKMTRSSNGSGQSSSVSDQNPAKNPPPKLTREAEIHQLGPQNRPKPFGSGSGQELETTSSPAGAKVELNGRERLKRHRVEMAGRVWIPDVWGQEELLKDWVDCTKFDAPLRNSSILSARAALVEEGRLGANSSRLSIENSC